MEPPAGSVGTPEINESINSAVAVVRCWCHVNPFLLSGAAQMGGAQRKMDSARGILFTPSPVLSFIPLKPSAPSRLAANRGD